jgi:hypothetical protein
MNSHTITNLKFIDLFHSFPFREDMTPRTKNALKELYQVIQNAPAPRFKRILDSAKNLNASSYIASNVAKFIKTNKGNKVTYECYLGRRRIIVHFVLYEAIPRKKYEQYMRLIMTVLYTLDHFSSKDCLKSKDLDIYLFMTPFPKRIPTKGVIGAESVNTGVNTKDVTCSSTHHETTNEIIIYRKEDWFKVLIHECIHSFRLDFPQDGKELLELFRVDSEVNLFEAYTEFWAEMINMMFCAICLETHQNVENVLEIMNVMIQVERRFTLFQAVKILHHMDLTYKSLVEETAKSFREESNVLAYFILKMCLMYHYNGFIDSCQKHCHNLLNFNESKLNELLSL